MRRLADLLYLLLLAAYVFALPPTFHGDESMQIAMSRDYFTAFVERNPAALATAPPYIVDTAPYLRLINGSVNRYAIGLAWHLAGYTAADLPPDPGWLWERDYDTTASAGYLPSTDQLAVARFPSTLFLALSIPVIFTIGWHFGGRLPAYLVSGLYALHPVVLLNGRRAMQEGSMLFFGLLAILFSALISRFSADPPLLIPRTPTSSTNPPLPDSRPTRFSADPPLLIRVLSWIGLIGSGGLALASKHSAIIFVAGALLWIFAAEFVRLRWRTLVITSLKLTLATLFIALLFILLSPALWSDLPARLADLLTERAVLLDNQIAALGAPLLIPQRVANILREPFTAPPQHYEVAFWNTFPAITRDIQHYMESPLSGIPYGIILGGALTLLAGIGIAYSLLNLRSRGGIYAGILAWLLVAVASLIANPLPWQRYYLPLIPLAILLAGIGISKILRLAQRSITPVLGAKPQTD